QDVEGRVAHQVLTFAELYGQANAHGEVLIPIRLTQRDWAGLVGATRERVNQVMSAYKQRRYISVDQRHRITVHNHEALNKRASSALRRSDARAILWGNRSGPRPFERGNGIG